MINSGSRKFGGILAALLLVMSLLAVVPAEARMGGSFGSRGMRTFNAPPVTRMAPKPTAPINRTMTPNPGTQANPGVNRGLDAAPAANRGGFMSGLGGGLVGGLLGGLLFSGLFGSLFGAGFGGLGGGFAMIFQILLIGGAIWLALRFFRRQQAAATPSGYASASPFATTRDYGGAQPAFGGGSPNVSAASNGNEIGVGNADLETFERLLHEVQEAFSREDHQALRTLTTPEMVSYLSEELAENATHGLRNDVTDLKFLEGDVAEAWREGSSDYATVVMQWRAIDVLRDRQTGEVKRGSADVPVETREYWTFVRHSGGPWQLSAIQEAGG